MNGAVFVDSGNGRSSFVFRSELGQDAASRCRWSKAWSIESKKRFGLMAPSCRCWKSLRAWCLLRSSPATCCSQPDISAYETIAGYKNSVDELEAAVRLREKESLTAEVNEARLKRLDDFEPQGGKPKRSAPRL